MSYGGHAQLCMATSHKDCEDPCVISEEWRRICLWNGAKEAFVSAREVVRPRMRVTWLHHGPPTSTQTQCGRFPFGEKEFDKGDGAQTDFCLVYLIIRTDLLKN